RFDQRLYDTINAADSARAARERADALVAQGERDKVVDTNEARSLAADTTSRWERYFLAYDPAPALRKLTVPVLALNGSLDVQVPARENLAAMRRPGGQSAGDHRRAARHEPLAAGCDERRPRRVQRHRGNDVPAGACTRLRLGETLEWTAR